MMMILTMMIIINEDNNNNDECRPVMQKCTSLALRHPLLPKDPHPLEFHP